MEHALSYMIIDGESGNALASFDELWDARGCLELMAKEDPDRADALALIGFDHDGLALATEFPSDL